MCKIKIIITVLLCAGLFVACDKNYNDGVSNETPHYVYVSSPVNVAVSATDLVYSGENETTCEFKVKYGMTDSKNATIEASIAPDVSLVEAYNKSKSKSFLPYPTEYLSFPTTAVNIAAGSTETNISFKLINLDKLPNGEYLLPVTIKSVKASNGFPLHEDKKTAYYQVSRGNKPLSYVLYTFAGPDFSAAGVPGGLPLTFEIPVTAAAGPGGRGAALISKNNSVKVPSLKGLTMGTYTLLLDVFPLGTDQDYAAIFQANEANQGDDADIYIRGNGAIGAGAYSAADVVKMNQWNRIVLVVDVPNRVCDFYINGNPRFKNPGRTGYMTLGSSHFWLFADAYGHDYEYDAYCAGFALWDRVLTEEEITKLGDSNNSLQL